MVTVATIGTAAIAILTDRKVATLLLKNLANSPHILLYCSWLLISQLLVALVYGDVALDSLWRAAAYILSAFVGYLLLPCAIGQKGTAAWWNLLLAVGTVASGLGVYVALTGQNELLGLHLMVSRYIAIWDLYATSGPFNEANIFGFASALGVVAGLYRLRATKQVRSRLVAFISIGICGAATLFSWSRAMYVALPAGFVAWMLIGSRLRIKLLAVSIGGLMIMIGLNLAENNPLVRYLLQLDLGLAGREVLWPAAIRAILDRPITGYGLSPFLLVSTVYRYGGAEWADEPLAAHNGFLDLAVQAGALVTLLYICAIVIAFVRLLTSSAPVEVKRSLAAGMTIAVVAVTFLGYSLGGASYGSLTLTIMFGLGNAMPLIYGHAVRGRGTAEEKEKSTFGRRYSLSTYEGDGA
jgi:O-antigen ligase